jgi:hypothetical protein
MKSRLSGYLLVGLVGATAGGAVVARASDSIPRLMRGMVSMMIEEMARQGISPDT